MKIGLLIDIAYLQLADNNVSITTQHDNYSYF